MQICFFGLYGEENPRNAVLRRGLAEAGVEVLECNGPLDLGATPSLTPLRRSARLARKFRKFGRVDAVYVPEFNQALVPLAWALARRHNVPVFADFLVSLYDTAVRDRGQSPFRARSARLWIADSLAVRLADGIVVDTAANAAFYASDFGDGLLDKVTVIQVGAPEWLFTPSPLPERRAKPLKILFYGSYIPLHGVEHVVEAARLLRDDRRFEFVLVGRGQTLPEVHGRYERDPSGNVLFREPVALVDLPRLVREADICLGIFGSTAKAERVVPNKVWQCLAAGRPVVTGAGTAAKAVFEDGRHCLLVPHADPAAIARALVELAEHPDLTIRIAQEGANLVQRRYTSAQLGRELLAAVETSINRPRGMP